MIRKLARRSLWSLVALVAIGGPVVFALDREDSLYQECLDSNRTPNNLGDGQPFVEGFSAPRDSLDPVRVMCSEGRFLPFVNLR